MCASDRPDQVHNYLHKDRWQFAKIHQLFHAFGNSTEGSPGLCPNVQGHHITHLNQSCSVTVHDWGPTAYYLNGVMQPFSPDRQPGEIPLFEEQVARPWYSLTLNTAFFTPPSKDFININTYQILTSFT